MTSQVVVYGLRSTAVSTWHRTVFSRNVSPTSTHKVTQPGRHGNNGATVRATRREGGLNDGFRSLGADARAELKSAD